MKAQKIILSIFLFLAVFLLGFSSITQFDLDSNLVEIKLYKNLDKVHRNSQLPVAVEVKIDEGWHINSEAPNDEFLVPTTLDLISAENFELTAVQYPDPILLRLAFSEEPVSVFEGKILIGGILKIPEDLELGDYKVTLELYYQACDDRTCQPPKTIEANLSIKVVDDNTQVKKINTEIFSKIKF